MNCPKCDEVCYRESADIGVGVIHGPYGCPACGWSEWAEYDRSSGPSPAQEAHPGWHVDQFGGMQRVSAIADHCERFGIPREVVEESFADDPVRKDGGSASG